MNVGPHVLLYCSKESFFFVALLWAGFINLPGGGFGANLTERCFAKLKQKHVFFLSFASKSHMTWHVEAADAVEISPSAYRRSEMRLHGELE